MRVPNLLTLKRLAQLFNTAEEDILLAVAQDPPVREIARADGARVFDREAADIIRHRLERMEGDDHEV